MLAMKIGTLRPLGTEAEAAEAIRGSLDECGSGLFKRVYLSRDGKVVYKVSRGGSRNDEVTEGRRLAITAEAAWIAYGRRKHVPGIPPATVYVINGEPVLAMPYYSIDGDDLRRDPQYSFDRRTRMFNAWYAMGLVDLHDGNYRGDGHGRIFVVDLGGWGADAPLDSLPDPLRDIESSTCDRDDPSYMSDEDEEHEDCTTCCVCEAHEHRRRECDPAYCYQETCYAARHPEPEPEPSKIKIMLEPSQGLDWNGGVVAP